MSYSNYAKGSRAESVYNEFDDSLQRLEDAASDVSTASDSAADEVEELERLLKAKTNEFEELKEATQLAGADEFLRVMKNIRTYVNDYIYKLEPKDGEDKPTTTGKQE